MIAVNERWIIQIDDYNYTVCQNKPQEYTLKDGSKGVRYPTRGYFRTVTDALQFIFDEEVRVSLGDGTKSLCEAVEAIRTARNEVRGMIDRIMEDDRR